MSQVKTISISPELFKFSIDKNKSKNKTVGRVPSLNKNSSIRDNLLKRLNKNRNNDTKKNPIKMDSSVDKKEVNIKSQLEDELKSSMNYLSNKVEYKRVHPTLTSMSVNSKTDNTFQNNIPIGSGHPIQNIVDNNKNHTLKNYDGAIKHNIGNDLPYGCLKGGKKPTFKNWVKTLKNNSNTVNVNITNSGDVMSNNTLTDEEKYRLIKKKLQGMQSNKVSSQPIQIDEVRDRDRDIIKIPDTILIENETIQIPEVVKMEQIIKIPEMIQEIDNKNEPSLDILPILELEQVEKIQNMGITDEDNFVIPVKKTFKKKIKRTYTIGKNNKKRQVGLLLKNSQTMKNIMISHNNLKNEPIDKVEKYLRTHGFKVKGSSCPQDVSRKMYETAMLSGDIFNKNKDIYLQNMIGEKEKN